MASPWISLMFAGSHSSRGRFGRFAELSPPMSSWTTKRKQNCRSVPQRARVCSWIGQAYPNEESWLQWLIRIDYTNWIPWDGSVIIFFIDMLRQSPLTTFCNSLALSRNTKALARQFRQEDCLASARRSVPFQKDRGGPGPPCP